MESSWSFYCTVATHPVENTLTSWIATSIQKDNPIMFTTFRSRFGRNVELRIFKDDGSCETKLAQLYPEIDGLIKTNDGRVWLIPIREGSVNFRGVVGVQSHVPYIQNFEELTKIEVDDRTKWFGLLPPMRFALVPEDSWYSLSIDTSFTDWLSYLSSTRSTDDVLKEQIINLQRRFNTQVDRTVDDELRRWEELDRRATLRFWVKYFLSSLFPRI